MRRIVSTIVLTCAAAIAFSFDVPSTNLHVYIAELREASAPVILENSIVFSVKGVHRSVGIAFAHENWAQTHYFQRNRHGVFIYVYPIPLETKGPLMYRLVIDGIWAADPKNPQFQRDFVTNVEFSLVAIPYIRKQTLGTWDPAGNGNNYVHFYYRGVPGQIIYVTGSFANWDPFLYEMEETDPGEYWLKLMLPPGTYYYAFIIQGRKVPDPLNNRIVYTKDGLAISELIVTGIRN